MEWKRYSSDYKVCQVNCACGEIVLRQNQMLNFKSWYLFILSPILQEEQKLVDAAGRVEKFKAKYSMAK